MKIDWHEPGCPATRGEPCVCQEEGPQVCRCGCEEHRHVWDKTFTTAACRDCECLNWYDIEPACIATNLSNLADDLRKIGWHRRADYLITIANRLPGISSA